MNAFNRMTLVAAAIAATGLAVPPFAGAQAETKPAQIDRGFNPDTGQINQGHQPVPSTGETRAIPSQKEARAALMMKNTGRISTGESVPASAAGNAATQAERAANGTPSDNEKAAEAPMPSERATSGMADAGQPAGPIGAQLQTMPAKFSQRNDLLDRVPIMAWPLALDDAQRGRIFEAVMAEDTKPAEASENLAPARALNARQALNAMHPLPPSLRDIPGLQGLSYVKTDKDVFLVLPATRTVVDQLGQS